MRVLFGEKDGYLGWVDTISEMEDDSGLRKALRNDLRDLRKKVIANIEDYKFPVVLLSDTTPADAVCTIFETLNRTGVKLSVFDLLAARFWPQKVQLRDMWDKARAQYPLLEDYELDPYYLLQAVCLLKPGTAPSCKRKDVLDLTPVHVSEAWEKAVEGMSKALTILRDDCGVLIPKWVPYYTILVPFAALLAKRESEKGLLAGQIRQKIVRWFWCSVFGQTYENAPNSQTSRDFADVGSWLDGGQAPENIDNFSFEAQALFEVGPKQRALYRGVIAIILSQNPRDFHHVKPITRELIERDQIDDHHVFPDVFLRENIKVREAKRRDCILNRTLIDRATNQSLSRRSPSDYFSEMQKKLGKDKVDEVLSSHLLPTGKESPLLMDNYDAFLTWRCEIIGKTINKAIGRGQDL